MAEEAESLPLADRVLHKIWKVRLSAYEELFKLFQELEEGHPKFNEWTAGTWKKVVTDSNAAAQEKGVECLGAWLAGAKEGAKLAPTVCGPMVEKCLAGRANTKSKAVEVFLLFVERENPEPVVSALLGGCENKVPKVRVAALSTIREIISQFGPKPVGVKPILSHLVSFFDHPDKGVREEAFALTVELYKWLGPVVRTQIEALRPAQIKDLEVAFEAVKGSKPQPLRFTRSFVPEYSGGKGKESGEQVGKEEEEEIDTFDLLEPVNILAQIKAEWFDGIASPKWQVRKEQLDLLIGLAASPRLQAGDYHEIAKCLKKLLSDANVVVVSKAAKCLGLLSKGLRKDFPAAKQILPALLEKFKEKKQSVVEEIHTALDSMYEACFTFPDVIDDIQATSSNKVPKVRQDTLAWLVRCFSNSKSTAKRQSVSKVAKQFGSFFVLCLEDGSPEVRDAAASAMGALVGVIGERPIQAFLNKLDKIKLAKVKEHFPETMPPPVASNAAPSSPGNTAPPEKVVKANTSGSRPKTPTSKESKPVPKKTTTSLPTSQPKARVASKPPASKQSKTGTKKAAPKGKTSQSIPLPSMSVEDALAKASELLPQEITVGLKSSVWKERLAAMQGLSDLVEKIESSISNAEILVRQLQFKPGWKESNFQVSTLVYSCIAKMTIAFPQFPKSMIAPVVEGVVEKIGDPKLKSGCCECLSNLAEASNPQLVMEELFKHTSKHKNPKVIVEALGWIGDTIRDFGISSLDMKPLVDFLKECLDSTNPKVKEQAIKALGILRQFVGEGLRDFVNDVKPALLKPIDEEFAKVGNIPPSEPVKFCKEGARGPAKGSAGGLPREDIGSQVSSAIIKQLGDNDWSQRKEGIDAVEALILSANKRIEPNLGGLTAALKARLGDSNKNLIVSTLNLLGLIAAAMGPSVEKYLKSFMPATLATFSDSKKNVREAAALMMDAWLSEITMDPFMAFLSAPIESAVSRKDVLAWIVKHLPAFHTVKADTATLVKPLLDSLEDKNAEVRRDAEAILKELVQRHGCDFITRQCSDRKSTSMATINKLLQPFRDSGSTGPTSLSTSTTAKATTKKKDVKNSTAKTPVKVQKSSGSAQEGPLLVKTGQKDQRSKKHGKGRWVPSEEVPKDQVELLQDQFLPAVNSTLHNKLFSADFNQHVQALDDLSLAIPGLQSEIVDNLDLILKWCALRLLDSNVRVLKKETEFLHSLLEFLASQNYQLSDYEANSFLPYLVEKVGNNNETMKASLRGLFQPFCKVYAASKVFKFVLEGLSSKNARTRIECVEEIGVLMERHNTQHVCGNLAKVLPQIGEHLGDRDSHVRSAALNALATAYQHIGTALWKHLPNLPEAQKSALQDRLKQLETNPPSQSQVAPPPQKLAQPLSHPSPSSQPATAPSSHSASSPFKLDLDAFENQGHVANTIPMGLPPGLELLESPISTYSESNGRDSSWLSALQSGDHNRIIETLKLLDKPEAEAHSAPDPNQLVDELSQLLGESFSTITESASSLRLYKYVLNALHKFFAKPSFTKALSFECIGNVLTQLLEQMSSPKLSQMSEGTDLVRALNLLMIRFLDGGDKTAMVVILTQTLSNSIPEDLSIPYQNPKFTETVMKSLLKVAKSLHNCIDEINVDLVLRYIHSFLEDHPPAKWKGYEDLPLRAVKTVLGELVAKKGERIHDHLSLVPTEGASILAYISLLQGPAPSSHQVPVEIQQLKALLTTIFRKVGNRDTTNEGLQELYQFRKQHPHVDIEPHLRKTSEQFQAYIKNGLEDISRRAGTENQDPNTLQSHNSDHLAMSYMERLRKVQNQYGLKASETGVPPPFSSSATSNTVSVEELRNRLRAVSSGAQPQTEAPAAHASTTFEGNDISNPTPHNSGETSLSDLRNRLFRIQQSIQERASSEQKTTP